MVVFEDFGVEEVEFEMVGQLSDDDVARACLCYGLGAEGPITREVIG